MTAELIESFDHQIDSTDLIQSGFGSPGTPVFSVGRYGRGQRAQLPTAADTLTWTLANPVEVYMGAAVRLSALVGTASLFELRESATVQIGLSVDITGRVFLQRGATVLDTATIAGALAVGAENYIELRALIDNAAGAYEVRVNNTVVMSGAAVDTQETGNAFTDEVAFVGSAALLPDYDDIYVNNVAGAAPYNGFLGEHELLTRRPNGNGFQNDWVATPGPNNWDEVNDLISHDGDTTAISANNLNDIDSFAYENIAAVFPAGADNILSVQYKTAARGESGGYRVFVREPNGPTIANGPNITFNATYLYDRHQSLQDPFTAAPWVSAAWDAAEAGVELMVL